MLESWKLTITKDQYRDICVFAHCGISTTSRSSFDTSPTYTKVSSYLFVDSLIHTYPSVRHILQPGRCLQKVTFISVAYFQTDFNQFQLKFISKADFQPKGVA